MSNGKPTITFSKLVDELQRHYGPPAPPPSTDPLELIIWENIAYLANDKRRAEAFATLKQTIGTRPERSSFLNLENRLGCGVASLGHCDEG